MRIISIDVGIKNLALCCFEKKEDEDSFRIEQWDVINIGEKEPPICSFIENAKIKTKDKSKAKSNTTPKKNNKDKPDESNVNQETLCGKPAKFTKNDKCFCLKHAKKTNFLLPNSNLKPAFLNKQKVQKLFEMADQYHITYNTKSKKADILSLLNEYANNTCLESIDSVNASKIDIITIGRNIQSKLDEMFYKNANSSNSESFVIDYVLIENQISPIANRMKTIQGMISQYFIMKGNVKNIEFISASNKLKDLQSHNDNGKDKDNGKTKDKTTEPGEKLDYKDRKKAGVTKCLEYLTEHILFQPWIDIFQKHKKKDDLADCFLQGCWYWMKKM